MTAHIMPIRTYLVIFAALIALTLLTVALSFVELGAWHGCVGLVIATAKVVLVVLFFMHALYSSRLTWSVIIASVLWLTILMALTLADTLTRVWLSY